MAGDAPTAQGLSAHTCLGDHWSSLACSSAFRNSSYTLGALESSACIQGAGTEAASHMYMCVRVSVQQRTLTSVM